jgi:hypothetical protein
MHKITSILLFAALLGALSPLQAQQRSQGNLNFYEFDQRQYYFGITLGYNTGHYRVYQSSNFIGNDSIRRVESVTGPGVNLGIVTNLKIGDYFDIRFLPTLSFAERNINYAAVRPGAFPYNRKIESVFVEMPFQVRYKSEPYRDTRLFVLGGVKYAFDVASESRSRQADNLVKVVPTDLTFEVGAGVQFFFPFFIFSPEIKFSHGLGNVMLFDSRLPEASVIEKILSRTFTLSFHFEG